MNLLLRIINWCTPSNEKAFNGDNILQLIVFNFLSSATSAILLLYSIFNALQSNFDVFTILTNQLIFRKKPQINFATNILFLIVSAVLIWGLISGIIKQQGIIFYVLYPVIAISLLKKKYTNKFVFTFLIITVAIILLPNIF